MKKYKWDFLLIFIVVSILITWLVIWLIISISNKKDVLITYKGEEILRVDINTNKTYEIDGEISKMKIVVENGAVDVIYSECDGQDCVKHRKISEVGESIACIPNKVLITIEVAK